MIPGLAMMLAAYMVARLLVLPVQMHSRASAVYAVIIAVLGLCGVIFGLVRVYLATSGSITPSLP
jgi:hypothetical protein